MGKHHRKEAMALMGKVEQMKEERSAQDNRIQVLRDKVLHYKKETDLLEEESQNRKEEIEELQKSVKLRAKVSIMKKRSS